LKQLLRLHAKGVLCALAGLGLFAGCNPAESSTGEDSLKPQPIAFQGTIDPKFVGNWMATKGGSGLDLQKDGSVVISTTTPGPGGVKHGTIQGKWLVQDRNLLLQYSDGTHPQQTIKYQADLSTGDLALISAAARIKTVYKRK
jgi:hypothetical protein